MNVPSRTCSPPPEKKEDDNVTHDFNFEKKQHKNKQQFLFYPTMFIKQRLILKMRSELLIIQFFSETRP